MADDPPPDPEVWNGGRISRSFRATALLGRGDQGFLGLFSPVFNIEILDATELAGIVGHKRKLERTGVRRNEKIVRADHRSTRFERSTDLSIVKGCFVRKVQNLDMPQICIEGSMILLSPG